MSRRGECCSYLHTCTASTPYPCTIRHWVIRNKPRITQQNYIRLGRLSWLEHSYVQRDRCQLGPRYEGQLTRMAESIPPSGQSSSYSLTTLSSSSSTDRRAKTDRIVITTRIAVAHHFRYRLRRGGCCMLGATSSQLTVPSARLVIH